jgi:hypothetical protein
MFSGDGRRFVALPDSQNDTGRAVAVRSGRILVVGASHFGSTREFEFGVAALKTG